MISSESLKGKINNIAKNSNLSPQEILQMFFFERFIERLSRSDYKLNFIIKGGLLISSIIGIHNRTTLDMDTTIKGIPLKKDIIKSIILEIIDIPVEDGICFKFSKISSIREHDDYENYRVHLIAEFGKIKNTMKIDITTGDSITPKEIEYLYPCIFNNEKISVYAYPIETILAEKFESIIKRNISTTRMRDYYDVYTLYNLKKGELDFNILSKAILSTANKRQSLSYIEDSKEIIEDIKKDDYLQNLWDVYVKENAYTNNLNFKDTVEIIDVISGLIKYD